MTALIDIPDLPVAEMPGEAWRDRLVTQASAALDATMLRAMQFVVERALIPKPENLEALRASADDTLAPDLQREPRRFFEFLDSDEKPPEVESRYHRGLDGGAALRCKISGDYTPYGFSSDASPEPSPSGQPILVERWVHERRHPRTTIITLHGFTMGNPRIDATAMLAKHWFRHGLDVALLTLPYHGARTPADSYFSGDRFAVPHVSRLSEAMREAIYEVRLVTRWLQAETGAPVGLLGLSLGGYIASVLASVSDAPDFVIPMVPPVCIGDLAWRFFTRSRHYQNGGLPAFSKTELRAAFRIHSPLAHGLKIPRERAFIVAGRGDRIVPPEHPGALWEHWGRPKIHWFSGSHLAPFGRQQIVDAILGHLHEIDMA